jgi:FAD/FMN-containing dehydrogenase
VTAGAVRAYSLGEARTMPVAAFGDYPSALKFMVKAARNNLVQHICCWHWTLYTIIDHLGTYGRGAPADVLVHDPWAPPDERPYILVVPSIAGLKEHVEAGEKAFLRLAGEMGGRPYTDECLSQWPGAHKFFADHYRDHQPTTQFMGGYGEGFPMMPIVIADPNKIAGLEDWGLKFLRKSDLKLGLSYYSHTIDHGRSIFLRMTPFISGESSEKEKQKATEIRRKYMEQAYKRYGAVPIRFDYGTPPGQMLKKTGGLYKALRSIKSALDPDNIINPGMSISMYGRPSKKK